MSLIVMMSNVVAPPRVWPLGRKPPGNNLWATDKNNTKRSFDKKTLTQNTQCWSIGSHTGSGVQLFAAPN